MMTEAKKQRLAKELDTRVKYHRLTGLDDVGLLAAMSDRMLDYKALMDALGPEGMERLTRRLPGLRYYVLLLAMIAAGIHDGTAKVPE